MANNKNKNKKRPYKGPASARDPRIRALAAQNASPAPLINPYVAVNQANERLAERGARIGQDIRPPSKPVEVPPPTLTEIPKRRFGAAKWGLGAAGVGIGATVIHRNRNSNRKVKKMDFSKAADLPFKGVRRVSPNFGTRKKGQLVATEHFVNRNASSRTSELRRFTGKTKNPRNAVEHFGKALRPVGPGLAPKLKHKVNAKELRSVRRDMGEGYAPHLRTGMQDARTSTSARYSHGGYDQGTNYGRKMGYLRSRGVSKVDALPTRVTRLQPRTATGKYVGHANDLQVFHPKGGKKKRQTRTSALQHFTRVAKKDNQEYVTGRRRAMASTGGWHPIFAGKPGQKLEAFGSTMGHGLGGGIAGGVAANVLTRGKAGNGLARAAGSVGGAHAGFQRAVGSNQRKGRLKRDYSNSGPQGTGVAKSLFYGGADLTPALSGSIEMGAFARQQGRVGRRI